VVLLEMSGGMTSLSRAVPYDPKSDRSHSVQCIANFLAADGSQSVALSFTGGVHDAAVLRHLEMLLLPEPSSRSDMQACLSLLASPEQQKALMCE